MTDAPLPFEIDVAELARLRATGEAFALLDVREPWELEICRFDDSLAIPLQSLPAKLDELPRDRLLVVHCHHGGRSLRAVHWLRAQGFDKAVNLAGGVDAWSRDIDPAMRTY